MKKLVETEVSTVLYLKNKFHFHQTSSLHSLSCLTCFTVSNTHTYFSFFSADHIHLILTLDFLHTFVNEQNQQNFGLSEHYKSLDAEKIGSDSYKRLQLSYQNETFLLTALNKRNKEYINERDFEGI